MAEVARNWLDSYMVVIWRDSCFEWAFYYEQIFLGVEKGL